MPHIRIRAMTEVDVKNLSQILPKELSALMNTPEDNFTVERLPSVFFDLPKSNYFENGQHF